MRPKLELSRRTGQAGAVTNTTPCRRRSPGDALGQVAILQVRAILWLHASIRCRRKTHNHGACLLHSNRPRTVVLNDEEVGMGAFNRNRLAIKLRLALVFEEQGDFG